MPSPPAGDTDVLIELEPVAERLLERHLAATREWFPHELVPWARGQDYRPDERWDPNATSLAPAVRSAVFVNLLTEDNLPYYFNDIDRLFGRDGAWATWNRRWTAEEGRHAIVIRDWVTVTRALDPVDLERARMHQVQAGFAHPIDGVLEGLAYVTLQELATRISHRNTGRLLGDQPGYDVMARVAADENFHYLFYRDAMSAAIEVDPSASVIAIERQVRSFEMPGTGIVGFKRHAAEIARAGIYDFAAHHDQILVPVVLRHWKVDSMTGLSPEADEARGRLVRYIERVGRAARRQSDRRQQPLATSA